MTIQLTKSDFLDFLQCQKALWLAKHKPDAITWPTPSAFDRMLMKDGYAVEEQVKQLVAGWPDANSCRFQVDFATDEGLLARADLVRTNDDGKLELFEVKASTSLKSSTGQDHVVDAAFQKLVAEAVGHEIGGVHVIHINKEYVRSGNVEPAELLSIVDVSADVAERMPDVRAEVRMALALLAQEAIDENSCDCLWKSRSKHCAAFGYFNPSVPERSIYDLPRISTSKLQIFVSEGRLTLGEIDSSEVTRLQAPILKAAQTNTPVINRGRIESFLRDLTWPLYFFDYETFGSAIPIADTLHPHEQMPVQYSLHRLFEDDTLEHFEHISDQPAAQLDLIAQMERDIEPHGNLISWNKSFESGCNTRMAEVFPEKSDFLFGLNDRTVDLMDVFKEDYVDARFGGSTSIKKVLPVICPDLSYAENAVQDGASAMEAWLQMVTAESSSERERIRDELLAYCRLDTLAMVEILRFLQRMT